LLLYSIVIQVVKKQKKKRKKSNHNNNIASLFIDASRNNKISYAE
jgi:hypothetical protein